VAAGCDLKECLLERAKQYPSAKQTVIAHSHAGNIAFYAARASLIPDLKIVTLGTPFIQIEPRRVNKILDMLKTAALIIVLLAMSLAAIRLLIITSDSGLIEGKSDLAATTIIGVATAIYGGACFWLIYLGGRKTENWLNGTIFLAIAKRRQWLMNELSATCSSRHRLLVIRIRGDEAMRALSVIDRLAELPAASIGLLAGISEIGVLIGKATSKIFGRGGSSLFNLCPLPSSSL